jgi:hypothetical protein
VAVASQAQTYEAKSVDPSSPVTLLQTPREPATISSFESPLTFATWTDCTMGPTSLAASSSPVSASNTATPRKFVHAALRTATNSSLPSWFRSTSDWAYIVP